MPCKPAGQKTQDRCVIFKLSKKAVESTFLFALDVAPVHVNVHV